PSLSRPRSDLAVRPQRTPSGTGTRDRLAVRNDAIWAEGFAVNGYLVEPSDEAGAAAAYAPNVEGRDASGSTGGGQRGADRHAVFVKDHRAARIDRDDDVSPCVERERRALDRVVRSGDVPLEENAVSVRAEAVALPRRSEDLLVDHGERVA